MLTTFFNEHPKVALAFSGGVDSSYLLYEGVKSGADICGYYVKSQLQPEFELQDALRLAEDVGGRLKVLRFNILSSPGITENSPRRCYFCKKELFGLIARAALTDGYTQLIDGNNASDNADDRPGMMAAHELGVLSPLREQGLTKQDIRTLSRNANLFTWDKPAYSCLGTRVPSGREISAELLANIERGEGALFKLGFSNFRLRANGPDALLQLPQAQHGPATKMWETIKNNLSADFESVKLDPNPRR